MKEYHHGGNIHRARRELGCGTVDFSANINPLGPPEWLRSLVSRELEELRHYPDPEYQQLRAAIAASHNLSAECVVVANGTSDLLHFFMQQAAADGVHRLLLPVPSYVDYARAAEAAGIQILPLPLAEERGFFPDFSAIAAELAPGDLLLLGTPNNPNGSMPCGDDIRELARRHPQALILVDEAFLDFTENPRSLGAGADNLASINSMTKFYAVPGLRIGYGLFPEPLAAALRRLMPPWSVNTLAAAFARRAVADREYQRQSRALCRTLRAEIEQALAPLPLTLFPSVANFLFCRLHRHRADDLARWCRQHGLLIRCCNNYHGLSRAEQCFRIAVRSRRENEQLIDLFRQFFGIRRDRRSVPKRRAKAIMFQGTCSDAGKSILAAGLCRILFQDGISVAPFKAQNMSLNSFVTLQGDEMGRAQVVQAQAARLDPDCRMNPVLLKPDSDTGSQVIVAGKPVGNMRVAEYRRYKTTLWPRVCAIYDSLAAEHQVVVLEGAGSPGEINLKRDDIVNMRMAEYAESPVLLVGDIDRGGVYAAFIGIMETLAEWERQLLAGFVVNKFRGDASLLDAAHRAVEQHTGRPVLGVLPWQERLGLPEEDSVSFKKGSFNRRSELSRDEAVEIAVINLPHISNFTDVEPFLEEPDVDLRVVDRVQLLGSPDAIILPGSKNVLHDLQFLRDSGLADAISRECGSSCPLVGICGGYQFLGTTIRDPQGIESNLHEVQGLAFLDMVTVIEKEKNLVRRRGVHRPSGRPVFGYEIHHGVSSGGGELLSFDDGSSCGRASADGAIWGSYLHGIFDSDEFRRWFIDELRVNRGLAPVGKVLAPWDLEAAFDRLADAMRKNLNITEIYRLLEVS